jgi:hypothetical protein
MKVSILCPTRNNPAGAIRLANSAYKTSNNKKGFEVWFYVDSDDPKLKEYEQSIGRAGNSLVRLIVGPRESVSHIWNILAKHCTGDAMMMASDRLSFRTVGWDAIFEDRVRQFSDQLYVSWFNDGTSQCNYPLVSRKWYECIGYLSSGVFQNKYDNKWIEEVGRGIDRLSFIGNIELARGNPKTDESEMHNTEMIRHIDNQSWQDLAHVRQKNIIKLQEIIGGAVDD